MGGAKDLDEVDYYDADLNRRIQSRDWQNVGKILGRSPEECARRYAHGLCAPLSSRPAPEDAVNWAAMLPDRLHALKVKNHRISRRIIAQQADCSPTAISALAEGYYTGTLALRLRIEAALAAFEDGAEIVDNGTATATIRSEIIAAGWTVPAMASYLGVHRTTLYLSSISEGLKARIAAALSEGRAA
jgi:hypothetical protein